MNSSNDSRKISVSSCAFPGSIDLAESLLPVLAKYQAEDVFSSVFCILSWHQNRSIQECAAALNAALVSISKFGETPIDTYKCFEAFYSDIKQLCPISEYEDYVLPVMGHTKIDFNGKWWNALYGCGMTQEYPRLCFSNDVCKAANRLAEFESLLRYVDTMSENLHRGGWNADAAETIGMHLPPEKHWVCVRRWFATNPAKELCNGVVENLSDRAAFIEKMHFVRNGGQTTPLFNPSVLCDYFESCCNLIDPEEYTGIIDIALAKQAEMSFGLEGPNGECCIAYPCFKVGEGLLENCPATLLLFDGRDTVSIFYNHCQGDGNLESMRDLFATRHGRIDVIEGIKRGKGRRVLALSDSSALKLALIAYADNTIPVLEYTFVDKSRIADETCGSIDLISMLQASSNIEELNAYFLYLKSTSHRIMTMFAGLSDNFICWKESDRTIIQGAEDVGNPISIWCDFNETDRYYCELFSDVLVDYPIVNGSYLLGSPFSHCFTRDDRGFLNVKRKTGNVHVGVSKRLKGELDSYFFMRADHLAVAGLSIDQFEKEEHVYSLIKDALECLINSLEGEIGRFASLQGGLICIEYVAEECDDADSFKQVNERLGLKGVFVNGDYPVVRFSVSKSAFLRALMESDNRSIECDLGVGVLSLMLSDHDSSWEELLSAFERIRRNKKMVDTMEFAIPYVWQHRGFQVEETNVSRSKALKLVACAAKKAGAHPGEYYGTAANAILRSFQSDLIGYLKIELGKYKQKSLIVGLYEVMAEASHEFFLHTARFGSFGKLDDGEKKRLHDSTLDRREDARRRVRAAQYCIETVMSFGLGGSDIPGNQELSFIISLANQVLSSCDDADILLFEPKGFGIRISDDYTVSAIENEDATVNSRLLKMRQLLDPGHIGNETTDDLRYINKAKAAYKRDTGVSFECFLSVLDLLALGIDETDLGCHRVCNVVIVDRNHLNSFITAKLEDDFDSSELLSCVSRLIIDPSTLRIVDDCEYDFLPFGRKKNRPNRFELKPVVQIGDELIFSPVAMGVLEKRWVNGIVERFIPTKSSFSALYEVMEHWKRHYEKALERDAFDCFIKQGFKSQHVFKNLELKKKGNHPQSLGDYDVFAYDEISETVWLIECKEFEKIETAFDYMQLQERWFGKDGKLEKFERRISYARENADQIMDDLEFPWRHGPRIRALLVCNKLFTNTLGESNFEVVTLNELDALLANLCSHDAHAYSSEACKLATRR